MRILVFYQYFTTPRGSWSTRWYELATRWVRNGHSVTVVTSVYDKSDIRPSRWVERRVIDGVQVVAIGIRQANRHGVLVRLLTYFVYAIVSGWYALREPTDVVIASSGPLTVGFPGLVAQGSRRLPLVFEVRDLWPEGAVQLGVLRNRMLIAAARWFERLCYRRAVAVVALSPGMASGIVAVAPDARVTVIPNPADTARFYPGPLQAAPREIVYAGSLGMMDDAGQIVGLAEELARRGRLDLQIAVLGDGGERAGLEARIKSLGLSNIRFEGLRPKAEVAMRLRGAVCALVTFRAVPVLATVSPNKLFDALASGVPVVQTTSGWIRDLLAEHDCGLSVPANDPAAMADGVLRLTDDHALRGRMALNARTLAERKFEASKLARCYLSLLVELTTDPSVRPASQK